MSRLLLIPMLQTVYDVHLTQDEDNIWVAECLDLPGCVSDGDSIREALVNLSDAIEAVEEVMPKVG